jgi:enolase
MSVRICAVRAWEILDSRGNPTIAVSCELSTGVKAKAHAPSGASTGRHEALELRDGDPARYRGKGVLKAVGNVNDILGPAVCGMHADDQRALDERMIELDGTPDKSNLGANAILAISCAVARAAAIEADMPLWKYLAGTRTPRMVLPMVNILSGGLHAGGNVEFQDFLAIPRGVDGIRKQIEAIVDIHRTARQILDQHSYELTGVADEGGWGPKLESNERALAILTEAIDRSGHDCSIALDVAASHFYNGGEYLLTSENRRIDAAGMANLFDEWCRRYPITSIEDPLDQDDWEGWRTLTAKLGSRIQIIGDDFLTTNLARLNRGIETGAANAVLVKMNQIGTLTETFAVIERAREAGYNAVISARSGETEDDFLADLAVASGAGQIKVGSITRSERLAKYNRLFEIETELP